jgi:hypothetical protein
LEAASVTVAALPELNPQRPRATTALRPPSGRAAWAVNRRLSTIEGTEFGSRRERAAKRSDDSPLTVAFDDPVLQAAGLRGDRIGDAVEFFDLSQGDVHRLVCYCHYGRTVAAGVVAARVRMMAGQDEPATLSSRGMVIGGLSAAAALGLVFLAL